MIDQFAIPDYDVACVSDASPEFHLTWIFTEAKGATEFPEYTPYGFSFSSKAGSGSAF